MGLLDAAAEAVVEGIVDAAIDRIRREIEPDNQELAMMLAADRLKLRAHAQKRQNERGG